MAFSAYQVDNVIKAYSKQAKARFLRGEPFADPSQFGSSDSVTVRGKTEDNDIYQKISYTLLDLLSNLTICV
jgi:hypothetical protein